MMGVFSEFERAMIQERVRAGLARARDAGKQLGRPPIPEALEERIREARSGGLSVPLGLLQARQVKQTGFCRGSSDKSPRCRPVLTRH